MQLTGKSSTCQGSPTGVRHCCFCCTHVVPVQPATRGRSSLHGAATVQRCWLPRSSPIHREPPSAIRQWNLLRDPITHKSSHKLLRKLLCRKSPPTSMSVSSQRPVNCNLASTANSHARQINATLAGTIPAYI